MTSAMASVILGGLWFFGGAGGGSRGEPRPTGQGVWPCGLALGATSATAGVTSAVWWCHAFSRQQIRFCLARLRAMQGYLRKGLPMPRLLVILLLSACTTFPEVDAARSNLSATAQTPSLLTAEEMAILTGDPALAEIAGETAAARAARLRARADALRAQP